MTTKTKRELLGLIAMIVGGGGMYFLTKYIVFSVLMYLFAAMGGHGTLLALDLETAAKMAALLVFIFGGHKLFKVIAYGKDKPSADYQETPQKQHASPYRVTPRFLRFYTPRLLSKDYTSNLWLLKVIPKNIQQVFPSLSIDIYSISDWLHTTL